MVFDDGEMISTKLMLSHFVVDIVSISIGKCIHLYGSKGYTIKQKDKPLIAKITNRDFGVLTQTNGQRLKILLNTYVVSR